MVKKFLWLSLSIALLFVNVSVVAAGEVERYRLDNGLTVILQENRETQVVSVQVWVKAGSAYEKPGEEGITHLLEHMIFKGSPAHSTGQLSNLIESYGGDVNAYTTLDHTNYYLDAAGTHAKELVRLMADAVINASIDSKELALEKEVILEEIRRYRDNPESQLGQKIMEVSYGANHPFGKPVLGTEESVMAISRDDIIKYRSRLYRGSNMVLVVAGNFDSQALKPVIAEAFSALPASQGEKTAGYPVLPSAGPELVIIRKDVNQASISLTWPIPGLMSKEVFPLDMAAGIMGDGLASRLSWRLKEGLRLVDEVNAYAYTPLGPGLLQMQAYMDPGQVINAWQPMISEAFSLLDQPAQASELNRMRTKISAEFIRGEQTMNETARKLGYFELLRGGYENADEYLDRFRRVNSADISASLQRYLAPQHMKIIIQLPENASAPTQAQVESWAQKAWSLAIAPPVQDTTMVHTFNQGLTLIAIPRRSVPLVSMVIATPHSLAAEKESLAGINHLWASAVTSGNNMYDYGQMTYILDSMAATMQGFANRSSSGLGASFMADDWQAGLALFINTWLNPTFTQEDIDRSKEEQLATLRSQEDSPSYPVMSSMRALLFGNHPYGREAYGTPATIAAVTRQDLQRLHSNIVRTQNQVLVVLGDINTQEVLAQVEYLLAQQPKLDISPASFPLPPAPASQEKVLSKEGLQQTQLVVAFRAPAATSQNKYAAMLLEAVLGGMGGRLFMDLREEQSLAYSVFPFYNANRGSGVFAVYIATAPGKQQAALKGINRHLNMLRNQPVSEEELMRAKNYVLGVEAIAQQNYNIQAITIATDYVLGLGPDHQAKMAAAINALTPQQLMRAAQNIFNPENQITVIYGPAQ